MKLFTLAHDGVRLAFETYGKGETAIVLIHGWSCDRTCWASQIDKLSADTQVLALDLAGHGESDPARKYWTIEAFGADVAAVIREAHAREIILVGHSMGADVSLEAARLLKGHVRVRGLVWVDQYNQLPDFMSHEDVLKRVAPFRKDFQKATREFVRSLFAPTTDPAIVERITDTMASARPEIALPCIEATWNHTRVVPELLSEVHLPVVTINGSSVKSDAASLKKHGVELLVMPDVGHFPMWERPGEFGDYLKGALGIVMGKERH